MIKTASEFLQLTLRCSLATREQIKELTTLCAADDPPKPIAKIMIKKKYITRWQAEQLVAGRKDFRVGDYLLLQPLGTGSKGVVFKALYERDDSVCVIKILARNVMNKKGAMERWNQEVEIIKSLDHPNVIRAFRSDKVDDMHLLVMEYIDGRDLSWWLDEYGRLPIDWSCEVIRQTALGLQYVSERGVIHRDIKPGNILIQGDSADDFPTVKILDLGYARMRAEGSNDGTNLRLTRDNEVFGTPKYMAPEQAMSAKAADIRSDIYSLGCTLFKALTGDVPFNVSSSIDIIGNDRKKPPKASIYRSEVCKELEDIVIKSVAFEPEDRYQTPEDFVEALQPYSMNR